MEEKGKTEDGEGATAIISSKSPAERLCEAEPQAWWYRHREEEVTRGADKGRDEREKHQKDKGEICHIK